MRRVIEAAAATGANALLTFRFDTGELDNIWAEICARDTAITVGAAP